MQAQLIMNLCKRFHCRPSELMREPVWALQMVALAAEGEPDTPDFDEEF